MNEILLARWQFALTIGFHFIFVPLSIGLALLLVIVETLAWRTGQEVWDRAGRLFGKLLALTFAVGVATGVVMEFQFGTNWAEYSKFVGGIFGPPLAAETIFAFFLESVFLGLYLFGRGRVSRGMLWFSAVMISLGSIISAFWILAANSWQQTPAGFTIVNGRAELTDFFEAIVFNPSTWIRFWHTLSACFTAGAFFMAGVAAWMLVRRIDTDVAKKALALALPFGLAVSLTNVIPTGHEHAKQVARTQPAKFAAIEGLYSSQNAAPLVFFAIPDVAPPPQLRAKIEMPGMLSWMAFGDINAHVMGINEFPPDEIPPLWLSFVSFHNMVVLGGLFIAITAYGSWLLYRRKLWDQTWYLKTLPWLIPLPVAASQFGWVAAEVGRQPWTVYGILKTSDSVSVNVGAGHVVFSLVLLMTIYLALLLVWFFLSVRLVRQGVHGDIAGEGH
ncbi:MAG: cytochrome ubiquinol oxidase subunit I [Candidatus Zixiibacteriota bacterium]|nr:MAG: cytochrome ubiquinol oxidase subunit I [candidate division Zixibacteria bacterium]